MKEEEEEEEEEEEVIFIQKKGKKCSTIVVYLQYLSAGGEGAKQRTKQPKLPILVGLLLYETLLKVLYLPTPNGRAL